MRAYLSAITFAILANVFAGNPVAGVFVLIVFSVAFLFLMVFIYMALSDVLRSAITTWRARRAPHRTGGG